MDAKQERSEAETQGDPSASLIMALQGATALLDVAAAASHAIGTAEESPTLGKSIGVTIRVACVSIENVRLQMSRQPHGPAAERALEEAEALARAVRLSAH